MVIDIDNINARLVQATSDERAWLHGFLSFEDESSKFTRRRDGSVRVNQTRQVSLLRIDDVFPAGLVGRVKTAALKLGTIVSIVDKRTRPCTPLTWEQATGTDDPWLFDFQREAVEAALTRTRGIIDVPTGGGKTEIAVGLAMRLGMTNTLFIAPEVDLMHNAARRWELRTNVTAGRVGDGHMNTANGFTSATFQTLARRMANPNADIHGYLKTVGCLIIDEVHTLPADTCYQVAQAIPSYYRIGISGTPLARGDRRSLFSIAATGSIIYRVRPQLLIERGFISRPKIRMITHEQAGSAGSWQRAEADNIVNSSSRNRLLTQIATIAPKPGLVFVKLKKHGLHLTELFKRAGLRVEFVWGEKATAQRDDAIKRLRDGDLDLLVCSVVFQTGTDIPELRSITIGCGGKSEIATLQRIGRGMRVVRDAQGNVTKNEFYVFDVMDTEPKQHAGISANRWNAKHSRERFRTYTGAGHEVTIKDAP